MVLAHDVFVITNHRAIVMMFVRLSHLGGVGVVIMVHFNADLAALSLWSDSDSPMFWAP